MFYLRLAITSSVFSPKMVITPPVFSPKSDIIAFSTAVAKFNFVVQESVILRLTNFSYNTTIDSDVNLLFYAAAAIRA
jgi:hypothetical protein